MLRSIPPGPISYYADINFILQIVINFMLNIHIIILFQVSKQLMQILFSEKILFSLFSFNAKISKECIDIK